MAENQRWFYLENGQQKGPYTLEGLYELVRAQTILGDTRIWCEGWPDWRSYDEFRSDSQRPPSGGSKKVWGQARPALSAIELVVNTETVPGRKIERVIGLVQGNTVRAKHLGSDLAASLKNLVGGELRGYSALLAESRQEALSRMIQDAQNSGGNAVINVRFVTSAIQDSLQEYATEVCAYGTAVVLAPKG